MSSISRKWIRATVWILCSSTALLSNTVWAKDPCKTLACMYGKLGGAGSTLDGSESECKGPMSDFFSIVVKKHGKFKASATSDAREQFLNSCKGADENQGPVDGIIGKFGRVRSL